MTARIENRTIQEKKYFTFKPGMTPDLIKLLKTEDISVLVCGAISTKPANLIVENDIKLISFVTGHIQHITEALATDLSIKKSFIMPGCEKLHQQGLNTTTI